MKRSPHQPTRKYIQRTASLLVTISTILMTLTACNTGVIDLDVQGHRGCRGLLPENSLPAFERAYELGAKTLEMDVVITADSQVVVSHEAWMSHEICTKPDGTPVTEAEEKQHNIYLMPYAEVMRYDCGQRKHPRFSQQQSLPVFKPLMSAVIHHMEEQYVTSAEEYSDYTPSRPLPHYNIEIKTEPGTTFNPPPKDFVRLVLAELQAIDTTLQNGLSSRINLQSFDLEVLREIRRQDQHMRLALLVEEDEDYKQRLTELGFYPELLSPAFQHVDEEMLTFAATKNMQVIPWTVNEVEDMRRLIKLGVHGIITDYPDRLISLLQEL